MSIDLSVIIPHYNSTDTLDRLLATIPDRDNVQVIVVDDRSGEDERTKLSALRGRYPRVEFYSNDAGKKGAGTCRNIGIGKASGKWLAFADSDDYFLPGMYEKVSPYFDSASDIVYFLPTSVRLPSGETGDRHRMFETAVKMYLRRPSFANYIRMKSSIGNTTPVAKMIRADLVREHGIRYSEIRHANDVMFWTKAGFYSRKAVASPEYIYCITDSDGSMTHDMSWDVFRIRVGEHIRVCRFCALHYPQAELKYVHAAGGQNVIAALQRGYGIKRAIEIFGNYRRYRIPMFTLETFRLMFFRSSLFRSL